jgi:CHASE3 domain sensor protein
MPSEIMKSDKVSRFGKRLLLVFLVSAVCYIIALGAFFASSEVVRAAILTNTVKFLQ